MKKEVTVVVPTDNSYGDWSVDESQMKVFINDQSNDLAEKYERFLYKDHDGVAMDTVMIGDEIQKDAVVAYKTHPRVEDYDSPDPTGIDIEVVGIYPSEEVAKNRVAKWDLRTGIVDLAKTELGMGNQAMPLLEHIKASLQDEYSDNRQRLRRSIINTAMNEALDDKNTRNAYLKTETNSPSDNYLAQKLYLKGRQSTSSIENDEPVLSTDNIDMDAVITQLDKKADVYDMMSYEEIYLYGSIQEDAQKLIVDQLKAKANALDTESIIPTTVTEDFLKDTARLNAETQIESISSVVDSTPAIPDEDRLAMINYEEGQLTQFDRTFDQALQDGQLQKIGMTKNTIANSPLGQAYREDLTNIKQELARYSVEQESDIDLSDLTDNSLSK